ncbi:YbdD/YjiX family protein [Oerskovia sp. Sa1BUA8]|uniref:YbdD/YjiX family protein n=1 Tax=Oerskovia douganii TaxID=2762210 RepID=A0A9D5UA36_9CELL|nr:YbdD/YjiX family protein [Oerskovia douganii]MBE7701313.1 YbdD/YjiX family protein [Oerskovia douganii]
MGPVRDALARAARGAAWYVRQLMGDDAYRVYVEHRRAAHGPDVPVLDERQFWRQRMDDQDRNPGARCC